MNTTLSLGSGVGMIYFLIGSRWVMFAAKYPASRSSLTFLSATEEAIHLPCEPDPDMAGVFVGDRRERTRPLELKGGWAEEEGVG